MTKYSPLIYTQAAAGEPYTRPEVPSGLIRLFAVSKTWDPYSSNQDNRTEFWESESGAYTAEEVEILSTAGMSEDQYQKYLVDAIQVHMDSEAQSHGYDGILSLASYATSEHPKFGAEGLTGLTWRDSCWSVGLTIMQQVKQGIRTAPTKAEMLAALPVMQWPSA